LGGFVTSWLIAVDGTLNAAEFSEKAAQLSTKFGKYDLRRFFCGDEDLVHSGGKTYGISNQWDAGKIPALQKITESYPRLKIRFVKAEA